MAAMLLLVVALHGVALWLLMRRPPPPRETARSAVSLRIVPAPLQMPPSAVAEPPALAPRSPQPIARRSAPTARPTLPREPDAAPSDEPRAPVAATHAITIAPPAPAASAASAPDAPLRLDLPPRGLAGAAPRHPALDDPRANTPRDTPGSRMAAALGSDTRRIEEARGLGRLRVREGAACVDVRTARNTELDPFNQGIRPSPKVVEACP